MMGPVKELGTLTNTGCACFPWFLSFGNRTQNSRVAGARPNHLPIGDLELTQGGAASGTRDSLRNPVFEHRDRVRLFCFNSRLALLFITAVPLLFSNEVYMCFRTFEYGVMVFPEYVVLRKLLKALKAVQQDARRSSRSVAGVALATPTMQAVQESRSWKARGRSKVP
jgi:hypothetical protein